RHQIPLRRTEVHFLFCDKIVDLLDPPPRRFAPPLLARRGNCFFCQSRLSQICRWSRLVEVRGPLGLVLSSACDHPLRRSGEPLAIAIQSIQPSLEIPTTPAAEMD